MRRRFPLPRTMHPSLPCRVSVQHEHAGRWPRRGAPWQELRFSLAGGELHTCGGPFDLLDLLLGSYERERAGHPLTTAIRMAVTCYGPPEPDGPAGRRRQHRKLHLGMPPDYRFDAASGERVDEWVGRAWGLAAGFSY